MQVGRPLRVLVALAIPLLGSPSAAAPAAKASASAPAAGKPKAPAAPASAKPAPPPPAATAPTKPAAPAAPTAPTAPAKPATPVGQVAASKPAVAPAKKGATTGDSGPLSAIEATGLKSGIVVLERAGKPLGLGTVLNGDGRIVTSLSLLGDGRNLDAHFADGDVVPVRLGHADHPRDLALLVPQVSRPRPGLRGTRDVPDPGGPLRSFVASGSTATVGGVVTPSTQADPVIGTDGKTLTQVLSFVTPLPTASLGSPLLDREGDVGAIVTRAFRRTPGIPRAPVVIGTPVGVVREFLRRAPPSAALPALGIGVEGEAVDAGVVRGVRVTAARGPAAAARLRAGKDLASSDVVVAIDGAPVITPDALLSAVAKHALGDAVDLLVLGAGRYRHVTLVVAEAPR